MPGHFISVYKYTKFLAAQGVPILFIRQSVPKCARSRATIYQNFAHYFIQTQAKNKLIVVLKCICLELQKSISKL